MFGYVDIRTADNKGGYLIPDMPELKPFIEACEQECRKSSTHKVEVVRVKPEPHPNADKLLVVPVYGYTCCIGIDDWQDVTREPDGTFLAAYVPPDSIVDCTRPEFQFLRQKPIIVDGKLVGHTTDESITEIRTKAKRLRGVVSYGFLLPAPPGSAEGDDLADALGVRHYEPELDNVVRAKLKMPSGEETSAPNVYHVKYDVESLQRYVGAFTPGEPVLVTEKLDGSNGRFVYHDGKMHCGSRTEWKLEYPSLAHLTVDNLLANSGGKLTEERAKEIVERATNGPKKKNLWWYALERCPQLQVFCRLHPDHVVYGEVFGRQGRLKYTDDPDEVFFAAFDIMHDCRWLDAEKARGLLTLHGVPCVPLFNEVWPNRDDPFEIKPIPFDFEVLKRLVDGPSKWIGARCIREGIVVSSMEERYERSCGRMKLKMVSVDYLDFGGKQKKAAASSI